MYDIYNRKKDVLDDITNLVEQRYILLESKPSSGLKDYFKYRLKLRSIERTVQTMASRAIQEYGAPKVREAIRRGVKAQ